ncbi:hypothetical protein D8878_10715 [Streptococcus sanguinis]|nr:hypothetical protein D8878_10715 [Streptococcus sanguinis]
MNAYTKEKANIGEGEEFNAETIAQRIAYHWKDNKEVDDFWGAKSTVAGNEAFQINVVLKSTQNLTVWVFKQGDKVYMMSFEGDEDTLYEFIPYIEDTWSVSKDGGKSI